MGFHGAAVLTARAGMWTAEQYRDSLAMTAASDAVRASTPSRVNTINAAALS